MNSVSRVGHRTFHIGVATISLALFGWAIMAAIARFQGPEVLGEFALAQAIATPVLYLGWLSLRQQYLIDALDFGNAADHLFLRATVPAVVAVVALAGLAPVYGRDLVLSIFLPVFFLKYIEGFFDLSFGQMQRAGRTWFVAWTTALRCLAGTLLFFGLSQAGYATGSAIFVVAFCWAAVFAVQSRWVPADDAARDMKPTEHRGRLVVSLLPVTLAGAIASFTASLPRLVLERATDTRDLGYFSAAYHFLAVGLIVVASFTHAILPVLSQAIRQGRRGAFWRLLIGSSIALAGTCLLGAGLAWLIGDRLLGAIYGGAFADRGNLLVFAALASAPQYISAIAYTACYAAQLRRALIGSQIANAVTVVAVIVLTADILQEKSAFVGIAVGGSVQVLIAMLCLLAFWKRQDVSNTFKKELE